MSVRDASGIVTFSKEEYNDYQKYLASRREWPGISIHASKDKQVTLNIPMLIMELYRLIPYKEGRYVQFHPFNMPYIKIRKIDIVGIVINVKQNVNNLSLTIEDGTGVIDINYKLEQYRVLLNKRKEIDEKYRSQAGNLRKSETETFVNSVQKFPEIRPGFSYPNSTPVQDIAVLENNWWLETNHGLLGKEIQLYDYVHVTGYPCLDARFQGIPEEVTAEFIKRTRLTVYAVSVVCISEEMYNKKLLMWMGTTICQRYKEVENEYRATKA